MIKEKKPFQLKTIKRNKANWTKRTYLALLFYESPPVSLSTKTVSFLHNVRPACKKIKIKSIVASLILY